MKKRTITECKELLAEFFKKNIHENKFRDLAQAIENLNPNTFKMNQSQGKVKSYAPPHSRITVAPNVPQFNQFISTVQNSPDKFEVLYTDPQAKNNFINSLASLLNINPSNLSLAQRGTYSSGGYPAINVTLPNTSIPTGVVVFSFASSRVQAGAIHQTSVLQHVSTFLTNSNYQIIGSSLAPKGSHLPDVVINAQSPTKNQISIQLEVKGPAGKIFDKTIQRGTHPLPNETEKLLIDAIASTCAQSFNINASSLEQYIDELRKKFPQDQDKIGFVGDPHVIQSSGALLKKYFSTPLTQPILNAFYQHWAHHGDSYFAVTHQNSSYIWYTNHPVPGSKNPNPLNATPFDINSITGNISLTTYGTTGQGRLRVSILGTFNTRNTTSYP